MDVKVFAAIILIAFILFAVVVWRHEYKGYKASKDKVRYTTPEDQQFVICAVERCEHNHNGNCKLKYISHDVDGKCQNCEYKRKEKALQERPIKNHSNSSISAIEREVNG